MEKLDCYIEEQEGEIKKDICGSEVPDTEEEIAEIEAEVDDNVSYRLSGPDFRKKEIKKEENQAVMEFQKSGDLKILEMLYLNRIPTLNYWARKNRHLDNNSFKDIRGELTNIFLKTVKKYKAKRTTTVEGERRITRTDFNTYLYTSFNYALCNIYNKKKAKKRTPFSSEQKRLTNVLLSLDYVYGKSDDAGFTLKDVIADKTSGRDGRVAYNMQMEEILDVLALDSAPSTRDFLQGVSEGRSVSSLLQEYKIKTGRVKTDKEIIGKINNSRRPCVRIVSDLIKQKVPERFKLVDFHTTDSFVHYTIEMHKTKETDIILSRIRKLKKNKAFYLDKIKIA